MIDLCIETKWLVVAGTALLAVAAVAMLGRLFRDCARRGAALLREAGRRCMDCPDKRRGRRPIFDVLLVVTLALGMVHFAVTKPTNGVNQVIMDVYCCIGAAAGADGAAKKSSLQCKLLLLGEGTAFLSRKPTAAFADIYGTIAVQRSIGTQPYASSTATAFILNIGYFGGILRKAFA